MDSNITDLAHCLNIYLCNSGYFLRIKLFVFNYDTFQCIAGGFSDCSLPNSCLKPVFRRVFFVVVLVHICKMSIPVAFLGSYYKGRAYEMTPARVIFQLSGTDGTISIAERVISDSSGNSVFCKGNHSLLKRAIALLLLKTTASATACT